MAEMMSGHRRYKGVRQRKWGSWVSEIRLPNSRERIWLGSHDSPEKAARAFDAAAVCLRGRRTRLNCPDTPPPRLAAGARPLTIQQIQRAAARHAAAGDSPSETPRQDVGHAVADAPAAGFPSEDVGFLEALDWSFLDSPPPEGRREFSAEMDDFMYDNLSPIPAAADAPEDHEGMEFGTDSSLWSF